MASVKLQRLVAEGIEHHRAGRLSEANACYRQALLISPKCYDALHLSGLVSYQEGRHGEALELLGKAMKVHSTDEVCVMRYALALISNGRAAEAEKHLRFVVSRKPGLAEGWENLAYCLKLLDRFEDALQSHAKAVSLAPKSGLGWYNYGLTLSRLGRFPAALDCHDKALISDPGFALARFGRAQALHQLHRIPEAVDEYQRYLMLEPGNHEARSYRLFALQYLDAISRERLFDEHRAFGLALPTVPGVAFPNSREPGKKLRIGVIASELRVHSCSFFFEPLVRELSKGNYEWYFYFDHFREDAVSERLKSYSKAWRKVVGLSNSTVESMVRGDGPDLMIDITGHTAMNRLPLYSRRLAPVQISYLGYPDTTGLPAMDFRFTDHVCDPSEIADKFATERLVRFSSTAWAYQPPADAPEVSTRDDVSGTPFTFGSFNNLAKVTDRMLRVWSRLLSEVPGSRLMIKATGLGEPQMHEWYCGRLRAAGIAGEKVVLLERTSSMRDHLSLYAQVDVALDTFPYGGTTTTCEALWQGVPVVSLAGDRHASRVGASLLRAVGHPEWVASDEESYIAIGKSLANDRERLNLGRSKLRSAMAGSPLLDHAGQASRFGEALRACWTDWCSRQ